MGLDMSLTRKKYVKNWSHTPKEERFQGVAFKGNEAIELTKISYLEFEAMYWRKSNAIHNWFVENVQEGADDCGRYYVPQSKLRELVLLAETLLQKKDEEEAKKLLPPVKGFFFGSQDIDEYYWEDLSDTRYKLLEELEANPDDEFYYSSSW